MWMKPQDHPVQPAEPAEISSLFTLHTLESVRFCHTFPRMIKTSTGSQEVQQLWQTEAIFQHEKDYTAHLVFHQFH